MLTRLRILISGLLLVGVVLGAVVVYGHQQAAVRNPWLTPLPIQVGCAQLPGGEPSGCDALALPVGGPAFHAGVLVLHGTVRMTMIAARADRTTDDGQCASSLDLEARFRNLTHHTVQLPPDGVNVIGPRGVYPPSGYFYPGTWGSAGEWQTPDFYGSIEAPATLHASRALDVWTAYDVPVRAEMRLRAGWVDPWPEYLDPNHVTTPPTEAVYRVARNGATGCWAVRVRSPLQTQGDPPISSVQRVPHYGPAPTNCPPAAPMHRLRGGVNHAFGTAPLWVAPYSIDGTIHTGTGPRAQYRKEIWVVGPQLTGIVTVRGWDLVTGKAVRFGHGLAAAHRVLRMKPALDASMRRNNSGRFLFYGGYLFFPSSGCYVLVGRWKHGAELYPFAVGR